MKITVIAAQTCSRRSFNGGEMTGSDQRKHEAAESARRQFVRVTLQTADSRLLAKT